MAFKHEFKIKEIKKSYYSLLTNTVSCIAEQIPLTYKMIETVIIAVIICDMMMDFCRFKVKQKLGSWRNKTVLNLLSLYYFMVKKNHYDSRVNQGHLLGGGKCLEICSNIRYTRTKCVVWLEWIYFCVYFKVTRVDSHENLKQHMVSKMVEKLWCLRLGA